MILTFSNEYELYDETRYLYLEGRFITQDNDQGGSFFTLKYNKEFFKNSKFQNAYNLSKYLYYLPFELNSKNSEFSFQTNDYMQISYFKANNSFKKFSLDSSFDIKYDTGKKLSVVIFLFPKEIKIHERTLKVKLKVLNSNLLELKNLKDEDYDVKEINITNPMTLLAYKSRVVGMEIEKSLIKK